jgi:hypothetical protein
VHLTRKEQTEIAEPSERPAAVAAWETPPSVVQRVVMGLRTHVNGDEVVFRRPRLRFTAVNQIWTRATYRVLDEIGQEGGEEYTDQEPEDRNVRLVKSRSGDNRPNDDHHQRSYSSKQDVLQGRYPFDQSMGILFRAIVQAKHLVHRLEEDILLKMTFNSNPYRENLLHVP